MAASPSRKARKDTWNSPGGCGPEACGWRRAGCECRGASSTSMPSSGACADGTLRRGRYHGRMFSNLPPVTKALLVANGVVFVLQLLVGNPAFYGFMLWPLVDAGPFSQIPQFMPWQLVTYSFLHGSFPHVGFNM